MMNFMSFLSRENLIISLELETSSVFKMCSEVCSDGCMSIWAADLMTCGAPISSEKMFKMRYCEIELGSFCINLIP